MATQPEVVETTSLEEFLEALNDPRNNDKTVVRVEYSVDGGKLIWIPAKGVDY